MRIFIGGVACVGKTTIGAKLADILKWRFYDLDAETERFFGTSIERLQNSHPTRNGFRRDVAKALQRVLSLEDSRDCVIALPPRGLMGPCWKVVQKVQDAMIIVLHDTPENILERITFYDIDSRKTDKILTDDERCHYLREIRDDIRYFKRSWQKAHLVVDIAACCDAENAACKILEALPTNVVGKSTV
jgi:shikimate kinase